MKLNARKREELLNKGYIEAQIDNIEAVAVDCFSIHPKISVINFAGTCICQDDIDYETKSEVT